MLNKYIIGGIFIYAIATIYWLYVLKRFELTKVYPLQSMSYILILITGYFILKEPITRNSIIGTVIICFGIYIFSIK